MYKNLTLITTYFFIFILCIPYNSAFPRTFLSIVSILGVVGVLFSIILLISLHYYKKRNLFLIIMWFAWMVLASLINNSDVIGSVKYVYRLFSISILALYVFKNDKENAFCIISWILSFFLIIEAYSLLTHCFGYRFSQGSWTYNYFFPNRVQINKIFPFALFFGLISCKYGNKNGIISLIISCICGLYFIFGENVSTSIMGVIIISIIFIFTNIIKNNKIWRNILLFSSLICCFYVFIYPILLPYIRLIIEGLLNETITMSGRTMIWDQFFINLNGIHWLIGNGYGNGYYFYLGNTFASVSPHNQYLEIIFYFGIVGLMIFIQMSYIQIKTVKVNMNFFYSRVFIAVIIATFFMYIPATLYEYPFYYLFFIASFYLPEMKEKRIFRHIKIKPIHNINLYKEKETIF